MLRYHPVNLSAAADVRSIPATKEKHFRLEAVKYQLLTLSVIPQKCAYLC